VDRVLWLIDDETYLGQVSIRPELSTGYLMTYGGHIGYSIRPSSRRRGYGTEILALALAASREMNLKRVLVTCDSDNAASRKIIEHNGGIFESTMQMTPRAFRAEGRRPDTGVRKLRYWIDLDSGSDSGR
jgi:predicted acetyltransferase